MKPEIINSLTGLRAIAMLTIFCCHLRYLAETPYHGLYSLISNGRFGVNFFLLLSGFLLSLGYNNIMDENKVRYVSFVKERISRIYLPYLITMILAIPLYIFTVTLEEGSFNVKLFLSRLIINIGMIQSAIPFEKYNFSINEVSWFISTIFIIYLFTPCIVRLNHKAAKHYSPLKLIFLIFTVLVGYCCFYMVIREIEYVRFADYGLSIIYRNPLIRLFPFLLGIVGCNIYRFLGSLRIKKGSLPEILSIVVFLLWWIIAYKTGLPTVITECTDMLVSLLVVLVFVLSRSGIVSILLSKEIMLNLGNISLEFYLLHNLVIKYGIITAKHFSLDKGIAVLPLTVLFLALSLYGAFLFHHFVKWLSVTLRKNKQILNCF